jgi:hypothetical protein
MSVDVAECGGSWGIVSSDLLAFWPAANHLQKHNIVLRFDAGRFFKLYVDLLTRPVPVRMGRTD